MEKKVSLTKGVGKPGQPHSKKERESLDHYLTPYTTINLECFKDLNVRPETIKHLKESTGSMLFDLSFSNSFLCTYPQARETKVKLNKWNYTKKRLHSKGNHQ